jgi:glycosyltransferase involved in cell wall biosynthesis
MNIGIDISSIAYGTGVSDYSYDLVSNLLLHAKEEVIKPFGFSLRRRTQILNKLPQAQVYPVPPSALDFLWNKLHLIPVEKIVGDLNVYHSSDWTQAPSSAKKVTTVHDLSPFLYPQEMDPLVVDVHKRRMKWVVKECDKIICVSQNTANDMQRMFAVDPKRIAVIYEALPSRFLIKPRLSKHKNYLVTIGARQPRKNTGRLISAFLKHKDKYNLPSKLIVIGENAKVYDHPSIIYTGYVSDQEMVDLLAGSDAFVYPSLHEGFGLPILGSFYHKVPVITSNTSSMPEVAGEAAVLVDPYNEEAIAVGIATALKQKESLIEKGLQQLSKFSWTQTASQTLDAYIC